MKLRSSYSSILLFEAGSRDTNEINYFDALGNRQHITDAIDKILKEDDQEILLLKSGIEIPIERIHSVDGEISPNYSDDFFSCDCA